MTTRDELADIISRAISQDCPSERDMLDAADAILARWRLVPVEEGSCPECARGYHIHHSDVYRRCMIEPCACTWPTEQHRAADELTQHDQAAGHYDMCPGCGGSGPRDEA